MIKSNGRYCNHPGDFVQEKLNDHDRELIQKAYKLDYTNWMLVKPENAETIEGYEILNRHESHLYHVEEASIGNI